MGINKYKVFLNDRYTQQEHHHTSQISLYSHHLHILKYSYKHFIKIILYLYLWVYKMFRVLGVKRGAPSCVNGQSIPLVELQRYEFVLIHFQFSILKIFSKENGTSTIQCYCIGLKLATIFYQILSSMIYSL